MAIYEKYIGVKRDDFTDYKSLMKNFRITYPDTFNFAYDVIDVLGREKSQKTALVYVSGDKSEIKRYTFSDLSRESDRAANYLKSLGVKKGSVVLLILKRSYLFWFIMLALHKIGAVAVIATNILMKKDISYRCNKAKVDFAVITGDGEVTERFDEAVEDFDHEVIKLVTKGKKPAGGGWIDFDEGFSKAPAEWKRPRGAANPVAKDRMFMAFTSGTTGYPKLIAHDMTYPLGHLFTGVFWHRVVDGGLHFTISDTGWLKALWGKFYGQWLGETAVLVYDFDRFHGDDILWVLQHFGVTTFCVPPTMYRMMMQFDLSEYDLSSLVHCCSAGEALNPEIFNGWKKHTGLEIHEGFGQSETTICLGTPQGYVVPQVGSMGKPIAGYDIFVRSESGERCAPGETGEICIRATPKNKPCGLFCGYVDDEEANDKAWEGGVYHTGDTAYTDERGYFCYVGRNDDVIKSSGYRIGPFEVESALLEHPAVLEVAVTGVPDPIRGFSVKATIVLNKGYSSGPELIKELQDHVKRTTAPYKYPRVVEFVDELPKTISGKIRRVEIRKRDMEKS